MSDDSDDDSLSRSCSSSPTPIHAGRQNTENFLQFLRLPESIRRRVWRAFAKDPRDIEVSFALSDWWAPCSGNAKAPRFTSISPVPAVLHACSESREEGLKIFKKCFEVEVEEEEEWHDGWESDSTLVDDDSSDSSVQHFKFEENHHLAKKPKISGRKFVSSKRTRIERCIYINPVLDTLFVCFPAWTFDHFESILGVLKYDTDIDDIPESTDFLSTWSSTLVNCSAGVWSVDQIYDGCRHFVLCFQRHRLGKGAGMMTKTKLLGRRNLWLEPLSTCLIGRLGRWDLGWEEVVRMLRCWHDPLDVVTSALVRKDHGPEPEEAKENPKKPKRTRTRKRKRTSDMEN